MIDCILATDISNHPDRLSALKLKIDTFDIKKGENVDRMIFHNNPSKTYDNQQTLLSMCVHSADISNPAKPANIYKIWVDLIFQEFFNQGDLEKKINMPISALCNREININNSQIGFIELIVMPTFGALYEFMPSLKPYLTTIKSNLVRYQKMVHGEEKLKKSNVNK
jgi:hypothetical protein